MMHFKAHGRSSQLAPELFHPNLLNRLACRTVGPLERNSWTA